MNWILVAVIMLLGMITLFLLVMIPTVLLIRWILKSYLPNLRLKYQRNPAPASSQTIVSDCSQTINQTQTQTSEQPTQESLQD